MDTKINLAVVGSRGMNDFDLLEKEILKLYKIENIKYIVSGGAIGADTLAEQFANKYSIQTIILKPNWDKIGKSAGLIRNKDIIDTADEIIAFWDGESPGTRNSIYLARKAKKKINIIMFLETLNNKKINLEKIKEGPLK